MYLFFPYTNGWIKNYVMKKRVIYRMGDNEQLPYLVRYYIFSCRWFSVKLHNILLSDDDCMHDHPWKFISIILKGGYVEHTPGIGSKDVSKKIYHPGNILVRPAHWIHRLEIHQPAWTLVITFKKVRLWGFFTRNGWVPHYKYSEKDRC